MPLLLFALSRLDAESLLNSARQIPVWAVALLVGLQIATQLLVNLQWYWIARFSVAEISFGKMFYINCQGAAVDAITPGAKIGGEAARSLQISRMGNVSGEKAVATVALQKFFSMSAFIFAGLFFAGHLIGMAPQLRHMQFFVYGLSLLCLLMFAGVFISLRRIRARLLARKAPRFAWAQRARGFLLALLDNAAAVCADAKACAVLFLLSLLIWLLYPAKMYILAIQIFPDASAAYVGAAAFASYAVAMLPIFPGGLGGFEGTMSGLLLAMGLVASDAAVITILFRFVTFWFVMLLSLAVIASCKIARLFAGAVRSAKGRGKKRWLFAREGHILQWTSCETRLVSQEVSQFFGLGPAKLHFQRKFLQN